MKKKNFRKIMASLLAVVLSVMITVPAFAAGWGSSKTQNTSLGFDFGISSIFDRWSNWWDHLFDRNKSDQKTSDTKTDTTKQTDTDTDTKDNTNTGTSTDKEQTSDPKLTLVEDASTVSDGTKLHPHMWHHLKKQS